MNIVFDLDDTLYDVSKIFNSTLKFIFPNVSEEHYDAMYVTFRKYSNLYFDYSLQGEKELKEMQVMRIMNTLRDHNVGCNRNQAIEFHKHYEYNQYNITLSEEVKDILKELQRKGYKLGLITNGDSMRQRKKIESLGLEEYFEDKIIISGDYNFNKPDDEIFKHYEKISLGSKFIYVGDSYEHDVVGALKSGWGVIWINRRGLNKEHSVIECNHIEYLLDVNFKRLFDEA